MEKPVYKRVLIKISGEALAGEKKTGFDFDFIANVCKTVKSCVDMGVEVGIVVGGGNYIHPHTVMTLMELLKALCLLE